MSRRARLLLLAGLAAAALAAWAGWAWFAPQPSVRMDDAVLDPDAEVVALGAFEGADAFHRASGEVSVRRGAEGLFLRFEGYEATAGPDVYFYLVPDPAADSSEAVEGAGLRLLVPGGAKGGQATLRGAFNVPVPGGAGDPPLGAVVAWCDRFDTRFGVAGLAPT